MIDLSPYDFIDFGSSYGGCIDFAMKRLGGTNGLGVERHVGKYEKLITKGYVCINDDITKLELPKNSVKFVTISHVLEHLNSMDEVNKTIKLAVHAATDFVYIEGPSFEFDDYLDSVGFKFMWRDGHGHRIKPKIVDILDFGKRAGITNFSILTERPFILKSASPDIHPCESPPGVGTYDAKIHPPKKTFKFTKPLFRSFIMFLWLSNINKINHLNCRSKFKLGMP